MPEAPDIPSIETLTELVTQNMYRMVHTKAPMGFTGIEAYAWPELNDIPIEDYKIEILAVAPLQEGGNDEQPDGGYMSRCTIAGYGPGLMIGEFQHATPEQLARWNPPPEYIQLQGGWYLAGGSGGPVGPVPPPDLPLEAWPFDWAHPLIWVGVPGSILMGVVDRTGNAAKLWLVVDDQHVFEADFNENRAALIHANIPGGLVGSYRESVSILDAESRELHSTSHTHDLTPPLEPPSNLPES